MCARRLWLDLPNDTTRAVWQRSSTNWSSPQSAPASWRLLTRSWGWTMIRRTGLDGTMRTPFANGFARSPATLGRNLLRTSTIGQEARLPEADPSASPLAEFGGCPGPIGVSTLPARSQIGRAHV